ncbi:MAG: c-di-GMP-binding flagellar brake protein YcgR [Psychrobacter glaciei]|jgi:c-di-GMP-binding flagellar brake protein YcgR
MDGMEENKINFVDLKLIPGQVFQLEFEGYTNQREKVHLIGYRRNGSLIITSPMRNGIPASVKSGEKVTIRLFSAKMSSACAFQTEVITVSKTPYTHIHLKIPETVLIGEVRKGVRAEVEVVTRVDYFLDSEPKSTSAKIVDLSMNGARMLGRTFDFNEDTDVLLDFEIEVSGIKLDLEIKARVRSISPLEQGFAVGLQFEEVSPNEKIALQAFVLTKANDI